jgi:hypothetical protein
LTERLVKGMLKIGYQSSFFDFLLKIRNVSFVRLK